MIYVRDSRHRHRVVSTREESGERGGRDMASLVLLLGHGGAARRASEPERSGVRSPVRCVELFCLWPSGVRGVVCTLS